MQSGTMRLVAVALVIVAALAGAALLGHDEAYAAPCCSSCDLRYDRCIAACNGDPACEATCEERFGFCISHCIEGC